MTAVLIIIAVLTAITGYVIWAQKSLKIEGIPTIPEQDRPVVERNFFLQGLHSGTITQPNITSVIDVLSTYVYGDKQLINSVIIALLSGGHVIIQGQPGTGKTTLVRILARVCDFSYARIQCTPDLLPQDVIGAEMFDHKTNEFVLHHGPMMANIVHVDEINRATPKLQSAFLEAMQEQGVSIGNQYVALPSPFFVIATQNPYDAVGTYMLPYAQIDRFMIGAYTTGLEANEEYRLLQKSSQHTLNLSLPPVSHMITAQMIVEFQAAIQAIVIPDAVLQHAIACIHTVKIYNIPLSTRASKALIIAAKTRAYLQGKQAVEMTDIDSILPLVLKHRVTHILGREISNDTLYRIITGSAQKDDIVA